MRFSFTTIACIVLIFFSGSLNAFQQPDNNPVLKLKYKVINGKVMIRWIPEDPLTWEIGLRQGYILEKYLISEAEGSGKQLVFKTKEPILPMDYNAWEEFSTEDQVILLRDLIFIDQKDDQWIEDHYPDDFYDISKRNRSRFLFSNFIQNSHFNYTLKAGLGFLDEDVKPGEEYLYRIYLANGVPSSAVELNIKPNDYSEASLPELNCESGSEQIKFAWNTKDFVDDYYGYTLSWSENGIDFQAMSEAPFFNIYDHLDTLELFDNFYHTWSWPKKDTTFWFRLQGADYFGGISEQFSVCSGSGFEPVTFSPTITKSLQSDSNFAIIHWKLENEFQHLIEEFQVFRSDSMDGVYRPLLTGIDPVDRSVSVRMVELTNYYRIVAVPFRGPKVSSFPTLVMGIDEIPPSVPANFEGEIDSMGVVRFTWDANLETDLDGYVIYKSYVKEADFARITSRSLKTTSFNDTVNMQSGNELVYYKLQAVDKVNNRSAFSEVLEIKKVDVFPPAEPYIHSVKQTTDHIEVKWYDSGSKDVVLHKLFRKNLEDDHGWSLLEQLVKDSSPSVYKDFDVKTGEKYAYTLVAVDDDGLVSDFAKVAIGKLVDHKLIPAITDLDISYVPDNNEVVINWNYETSDLYKVVIYKGRDINRISQLDIVDGETEDFQDRQVRADHSYVYVLRAVFDDGTKSAFSEKLEITIPK
ncbi:MAG: hypothetical protein DWQ02_00665 [Bacteroidetes bacterium]|nr:MAG: hypothetical protein DWQ02_00665 [Bacteroidota bacterium]